MTMRQYTLMARLSGRLRTKQTWSRSVQSKLWGSVDCFELPDDNIWQMPKTSAPSVSRAAQAVPDADAYKSEDSASNLDDSKPHAEPAPLEELDADSDTDSYATLTYEVETQSDSELDSLPDADDVPRAQAPRPLHRSVTAPF